MMMRVLFALTLMLAVASAVFNLQNCGSTSDPTKLVSLTVTPDPIVLGKNITISFKAILSTNIDPQAAISAEVIVEKQLFGTWIQVPCFDNLGSCNYTNVCSVWDLLVKSTNLCPVLQRYNIPCTCTLNAGTYAIPPENTYVPNPGISWLDGELRVTVAAFLPNNSRLFCYQVTLTLASSETEKDTPIAIN